ncbi:MAG: fumarylacetoacetate hydrolase [Sphingomonas bacterium]|nr:fumarylacetoacetate hydrolase [Sphingomonas bacterium]
MRIAQYLDGEILRLGLVEGDELVEIGAGADGLRATTRDLLEAGAEGLEAARRAADGALRRPLRGVRLAPPVRPRKFLGLGLCYASHAREMERRGTAIPAHQVWFNKQVTAVNGPYDLIHLPRVSTCLDYEGELALVIGKRGRHIAARDAMSFVAGFMVCNDVSVRDWQQRSPTAMLGKSFDTHGPIGPWLTTIDEVPDPTSLSIRTWVEGELRQDGNTAEMIWSFGQMIEELSTVFTLEPGDILSTGTPAGVGQGFDPPRFLKAGQSVRVEIEGLGHIENSVVAEPLPAQIAG